MSDGIKVTQADFDAAAQKVFGLQRELDITNADHIALWLEHSAPLEGNISWFACRIIEAHEIEMAKARMAIEKAATERELELFEALDGLFAAKDALADFEREHPDNSTKAWDDLFYAVEFAEGAARAALAKAKGG